DWTDKWDRKFKFQPPVGKEQTISQHLTNLTPHYAFVVTNPNDPDNLRIEYRYKWACYYRTSELGADVVMSLLSRHEQFKDNPAAKAEERVNKRLEIFNFLVQAGFMEAAENQLARLRTDFPAQKEKLDTAAESIKKLVAMDRYDAIKEAVAAGRHKAAQT